MDLNNNTYIIAISSSGQFNNATVIPTRSLNYFLICLAFFIFCPLFYIICRFVKLLCFPVNSSADAAALSELEENSGIDVYVIDIDLFEGFIRNSEMSTDSESHRCLSFGLTTPYESCRLSSVRLPSQISKTCPSYDELYDLGSPPPTYEEWESKTFSSTIPAATESPPVCKETTFPGLQFEKLYRNLIYFAFYMFYRMKRFV